MAGRHADFHSHGCLTAPRGGQNVSVNDPCGARVAPVDPRTDELSFSGGEHSDDRALMWWRTWCIGRGIREEFPIWAPRCEDRGGVQPRSAKAFCRKRHSGPRTSTQ